MPRQTPSASDFTSVVRSSAVANDVASKPAGSPAAARAAGAAVRGGGGLASLGAIGSIVKQSVVAKAIAPPPVRATVTVAPLTPLQTQSGSIDAFIICYNSSGIGLWSARVASTGSDVIYAIATDSNGNVYVTGQSGANTVLTAYSSDGKAFGTTITSSATDVFIVKYNSSGVVQWITKISSIGSDDIGYSLATDSSGNLYVGGQMGNSGSAYNWDGSQFSTAIGNSGGPDAFLVKYNTNGVVQWVTRIASIHGSTPDTVRGIVTDVSNNVYVTGRYGGSGATDGTVYNSDGNPYATLTNSGGGDTFIVKYNTNGVAQLAWKPLSTASGDISYAISLDSSGNILVCGGTGNDTTATIYNADGSTFGTMSISGFDAFLLKYNSNGVVQWNTKIASANSDGAYSVSTDSSGNIYVSGVFGPNNAIFYNANSSSFATAMTSLGNPGAFLAKYNANGIAQWTSKLVSTGYQYGWSVTTDSTDNIYMVGEYGIYPITDATLRAFGSDGQAFSKSLSNTGSSDAYVVKYNSSGIIQWIAKAGGSGTDIASAIAVNKTSGNLYVAGQFSSNPLTIANA